MKKCVLAYSGGLDTSYCVKYLSALEYEVHAVLVNLGGFTAEEVAEVKSRAMAMGASSFEHIEGTQGYYQEIVRYLLFGNVLRNNTYPLSVSAERMHQALAIADYARSAGADAIAHGSTGAGNDQVRFDLVFQVKCPGIEILTPIRDQQLSRQQEISYLQSHGIEMSWEKAKYSINKGLWGTSVGGAETLTSNQSLPEEAWPTTVTKNRSELVEITFEAGEPVAINGDDAPPVAIIQQLSSIAAPFGIGRDVHVGDTIIGIKGRVGFEAAAPLVLVKAHHLLEKHTLGKWQQYWKQQLSEWYGMMLHEGLFLDPVMRDIEKFLEGTQKKVTGVCQVQLHPYRFELLGITSPNDLMQKQKGTYGEMNEGWTGEDVKGFTKILGNQIKAHD